MANEITRGASPLATITTPPPITVSGNSTVIGTVYDGVHFHLGTEELLPLIQKMVGNGVCQSHAADWALLNTELYNVFVVENEKYNSGCFSIAKSVALKYTEDEEYMKFSSLNAELLKLPCVFASKNQAFKTAPECYPALVGYITEIKPQRDLIKFSFVDCGQLRQQFINENLHLFGLKSTTVRNQLDEEHWCIKRGNLLKIVDELGITIY